VSVVLAAAAADDVIFVAICLHLPRAHTLIEAPWLANSGHGASIKLLHLPRAHTLPSPGASPLLPVLTWA
jgi:hypothetical protein